MLFAGSTIRRFHSFFFFNFKQAVVNSDYIQYTNYGTPFINKIAKLLKYSSIIRRSIMVNSNSTKAFTFLHVDLIYEIFATW